MMNGMMPERARGFSSRHPILANLIIIAIVAAIGLIITYLTLQIFTRHGEGEEVPRVENMSYSQAIRILHDKGFRIDIRDSLYKEGVKPGYVVEQFPKSGAIVKPGRKIFLYINAVHPREVVIDDDNNPMEDALKGFSFRQGMARLEELGFKNTTVRYVHGQTDRIIRILDNGRSIKKTERVALNVQLTVEVSDGRLGETNDSTDTESFDETAIEEPGTSANPDGQDGENAENPAFN